MKAFTELFDDLDSTTATLEKVAALKKYFATQNSADSMWTVLLLTGRTKRRALTGRDLRDLFMLSTGYPEWLIVECHAQVGDTAETLSLLAQTLGLCAKSSGHEEHSLTDWMEKRIPELAALADQEEQARMLMSWWKDLTQQEVFIVNKLMTGAFRVGVSEKLVIRALAELHGIPSDQIAHRLTGASLPGAAEFDKLISTEASTPSFSQPYPFCLAHAWQERSDEGWNGADWCVEWKFDGIRAQVISREGKIRIWSRGEEEITASFPDVAACLESLPAGTVLDGEIVILKDGQLGTFNDLQGRLGRKKVSAAVIKERPAGFIAYDCLEAEGADIRARTLRERKPVLAQVLAPVLGEKVQLSEVFAVQDLSELEARREESRGRHAEGVMIKNWNSPYTVGRKTGNWWKHKVDPLTLDAILLYAQAGSGRRANLYTDYTFALRDTREPEVKLIPFAKAYSGLDQEEIAELDRWIRTHTKEKFGPVRSVEPHHVFEIGFEGIARSKRHKSGIAVRFPRILRWRKDKPVDEADTLDSAESLLKKAQEVR